MHGIFLRKKHPGIFRFSTLTLPLDYYLLTTTTTIFSVFSIYMTVLSCLRFTNVKTGYRQQQQPQQSCSVFILYVRYFDRQEDKNKNKNKINKRNKL